MVGGEFQAAEVIKGEGPARLIRNGGESESRSRSADVEAAAWLASRVTVPIPGD